MTDTVRSPRPALLGESATSSRVRAVVELAKRYDYDAPHSHQVECLAGTLFMELEPLHRLSREDRKLLEFAAILHDIGYYLTARGHHKHSLQLIMLESLPQFTRSEKLVIANLARYHRKAFPSSSHAAFAILTEAEQKRVSLLAPLLRIADGLDRSRKAVIKELSCEIHESHIVLRVTSSQDATAELATVPIRSEMFLSVYGKRVEVEHHHIDVDKA